MVRLTYLLVLALSAITVSALNIGRVERSAAAEEEAPVSEAILPRVRPFLSSALHSLYLGSMQTTNKDHLGYNHT